MSGVSNYDGKTILFYFFDLRDLPGTPVVDVGSIFPMNWRFFPTLDPQVDLFVSRDLDSRYSLREQAAVTEWLEDRAVIHVMRDHPAHPFSMLGGMWGAKLHNGLVRRLFERSWKDILRDPQTYAAKELNGPDQDILDRHVWPWAQHLAISHDSYQ